MTNIRLSPRRDTSSFPSTTTAAECVSNACLGAGDQVYLSRSVISAACLPHGHLIPSPLAPFPPLPLHFATNTAAVFLTVKCRHTSHACPTHPCPPPMDSPCTPPSTGYSGHRDLDMITETNEDHKGACAGSYCVSHLQTTWYDSHCRAIPQTAKPMRRPLWSAVTTRIQAAGHGMQACWW